MRSKNWNEHNTGLKLRLRSWLNIMLSASRLETMQVSAVILCKNAHLIPLLYPLPVEFKIFVTAACTPRRIGLASKKRIFHRERLNAPNSICNGDRSIVTFHGSLIIPRPRNSIESVQVTKYIRDKCWFGVLSTHRALHHLRNVTSLRMI
jgi:hypothetical protein